MKEVTIRDKVGIWRKTFKVIPENRIVVGESLRSNLYEELANICTRAEMLFVPLDFSYDNVNINHAKTKCDPKDEWNEKTGIDVCSAKLDLKEHLRIARKIERALVIMNSLMRKMEDVCQKHKTKAKAIRKDLEDYYGGIYR